MIEYPIPESEFFGWSHSYVILTDETVEFIRKHKLEIVCRWEEYKDIEEDEFEPFTIKEAVAKYDLPEKSFNGMNYKNSGRFKVVGPSEIILLFKMMHDVN